MHLPHLYLHTSLYQTKSQGEKARVERKDRLFTHTHTHTRAHTHTLSHTHTHTHTHTLTDTRPRLKSRRSYVVKAYGHEVNTHTHTSRTQAVSYFRCIYVSAKSYRPPRCCWLPLAQGESERGSKPPTRPRETLTPRGRTRWRGRNPMRGGARYESFSLFLSRLPI